MSLALVLGVTGAATAATRDNAGPASLRTEQAIDYVVQATVTVGSTPMGVTYWSGPLPGSSDDRVYVTNFFDSTISVLDADSNQVIETIGASNGLSAGSGPTGIATGFDDTIYVALYGPDTLGRLDPNTNTMIDSVAVGASGANPAAAAVIGDVASGDETVVVGSLGNLVSIFSANPFALSGTVPAQGVGVAAGPDDTVYVSNYSGNEVSVIDAANSMRDDTLAAGAGPWGLALAGDDTLYVADSSASFVSVVRRSTSSVVGTASVGDGPRGVLYDPNFNRVYVSNYDGGNGNTVSVIDAATNSAIATVTVGAGPWNMAINPTGSKLWVANYSAGTVSVLSATVIPPTPVPVSPPGAPLAPAAAAADSAVDVTWQVPSSGGSYPITHYQVTATPGGKSCLVPSPTLTCRVTGLSNGTSYTFRVRALNGAGWGPDSELTSPVTPEPDPPPVIQVWGTRDSEDVRYVRVDGLAKGLAGELVTPWLRFPGETRFQPGRTSRSVAVDGRFTWRRKTEREITVYFTYATAKSNTVVIGARERRLPRSESS